METKQTSSVGIMAFATDVLAPSAEAPRVGTTWRQRVKAGLRAHRHSLLLMGLTLAAAGLRLHGLADKSIWYDEAFVITLAQRSIPDMVRALIQLDPHPPLYYLVMHFWLALGSDPFTVRLPSVVLSTLSVPLAYLTAARLGDRDAAWAAAAMLSFSSFHVYWAQEARMYSLLGLLCLGSTYFLVRAIQEGGRFNWILHSVLSAASLYTQANAVFYLSAQAAAVVLMLARRRDLKGLVRPWAKSQVVAALLFVPWLPALLMQNSAYGSVTLAPTTFLAVERLLWQFGYDNLPYWHAPLGLAVEGRVVLVAAPLVLALLGARALRGRIGATLLPFLFAGTVALLALAGLWKGIFLPKTVISASVAYYTLLAQGLAAFSRRMVLVAGVAVVVALNLLGTARYYGMGSQEDWNATVAYLGRHFGPGQVLLVDSSAGLMPLNYYLELEGRSIEAHGVPFKPWTAAPPPLTDDDFRRVNELVADRPAIWLVVYRNGFPDPDGQLLPFLSARYDLVDTRSLAKVRLFRFEPRRSPAHADPSPAEPAFPLRKDAPTLPLPLGEGAPTLPLPLGEGRYEGLATATERALTPALSQGERGLGDLSQGERGLGDLSQARRDQEGPGSPGTGSPPIIPAVPGASGGLTGIYFGAWVGERVNVPGDLPLFEKAIGKKLSIVHRYSNNPPHLGQRFDAAWGNSVREGGAIPMLSWQPGFGAGTRNLAEVASGERDQFVAAWADQLRDWGHPIFFRMMWEQNSPWYPWRAYQEPQISDFIAAWRHIVEVFRKRGADNVTFVWSPHVSGNGASDVMPTYPGDEYVDWVALDGYPFRGGRGDFAETFGPDYDLLASQLTKPIMIAETSLESWSDEQKSRWIHDILGRQLPSRFPRVEALVWFDEKNTDGADFSILQDQGPLSREAFRQEIASPYYLSNQFGGLDVTPIPPLDGPGTADYSSFARRVK